MQGNPGSEKMDRTQTKLLMKVSAKDKVEEVPEEEYVHEDARWAWDDITGKVLNPADVKKARLEEMAYVNDKGVWKEVDRKWAIAQGIPIVGTRWIDVDKGDANEPKLRSRLVAQEYNDGQEYLGLFAATPPLEALRLLVSEAASVEEEDKYILIADVSRAFFEAPAVRTVCVELPSEAFEDGVADAGKVGLLQLSLYGTRDAAANFQREVSKFMKSQGCTQSKYNPCTYQRKDRKIVVLVHGDDFVVTGNRRDVLEFKKALESRFEIKSTLVGPPRNPTKEELGWGGKKVRWADAEEEVTEVQEARILNRVIRVTERGWEYEADQRHRDLIVQQLGLTSARPVSAPGSEEKGGEELELPLSNQDHKEFRQVAARANYLAMDRPDIAYAVKEVCRGMAAPLVHHARKLKRIGRYLAGSPRLIWKFEWQQPQAITAFSDSDWAGCRRTARSTTGGVLMRGTHCIKAFSVTQRRVTLSSAEAELGAAVKVAAEAIGIEQLAEGMGVSFAGYSSRVFVDSSAALGVVGRRGNGKLRHVRVGQLWVQQLAEDGDVQFLKVSGTQNPADLFTKHLPAMKIAELCSRASLVHADGRADSSLII